MDQSDLPKTAAELTARMDAVKRRIEEDQGAAQARFIQDFLAKPGDSSHGELVTVAYFSERFDISARHMLWIVRTQQRFLSRAAMTE